MNSESLQARFLRLYKLVSDNFLLLVAILVILPVILITAYVHPTGDDFNFANLRHNMGFIELEKYFLTRVGGRYTVFLFYSLPLLPDLPVTKTITSETLLAYRSFPVFIISLLVLSLYHLMGSLFVTIKKGEMIWISLGLLVAFLTSIHPSSIYWLSGSIIYGFAMSSVILYISMLIRLFEKPDGLRFVYASATGAFSLGLTESAIVVINLINFIVCIHIFTLSGHKRNKFLTLFGIMFFFSLIAFFAPGNSTRGQLASFERERDILFTLLMSTEKSIRNGLYWFTISILVNLLLLDYVRRKGLALKPMLAKIKGTTLLATTIACVILSYAPNAWARGGTDPDYRVVDFIQYIFVVGLFLYVLHLDQRWSQPDHGHLPLHFSNSLRFILILTLLCTLHTSTKLKTQLKDLFVKAPAFDREMMARYRFIASTNADTVIVPSVKNLPITIYFDDLRVDPGNWRNLNYSQYFNKKHMRIASDNRFREALFGME